MKTDDLREIKKKIREASRRKGVGVAEVADLLGENENTVRAWLRRRCPLLQRALHSSADVGVDSAGRRDDRRFIEKAEVARILAVNRIWIPIAEISARLPSYRNLRGACRRKRLLALDRELSHNVCRWFGGGPGYGYRLHASLILQMADHVGDHQFAKELRKTIRQYSKQAAKALAHWTEDAHPQGNGQQPPDAREPEGGTGEVNNRGGRPRKLDALREVIGEMPGAANTKIAATYNRRFASPIAAGAMQRVDAYRVRMVKANMRRGR